MAAPAKTRPQKIETETFEGLSLEEQIRQRAYEIYVMRESDGQEGSAIKDWLQAEADILNKRRG